MPYKSDAQRRFMYWAESEGKVPKGTANKWQKHTKKKNLPERVKESEFNLNGFANGVIAFMEKNALDMSDLWTKTVAGSETKSTEQDKIKRFMQNDTIDAIISKVKADYRTSDEEKERIIQSLLGIRQQVAQPSAISGGGLATGGLSGLLLSLLTLPGSNMSLAAKLLIGSLMTGAGGALGGLLGSGGGFKEEGPRGTGRYINMFRS